MFMRRRILISFATCALLISIIAAGGCSFLKPSFNGGVIEPPLPAPEINLADHNGNNFQVSALRGKVVLIFFGYTNCPDECPATMAHLKLTLDALGDKASDVQVVMVTTDPARDTPQAVKEFLAHFSPTFLGIPGTQEQLEKVWKDYSVAVLDGGETHSNFTYVIDKQGNIRETFNPEMTPDEMASDLKILLKEK
jgi:protein SCO1/2